MKVLLSGSARTDYKPSFLARPDEGQPQLGINVIQSEGAKLQ